MSKRRTAEPPKPFIGAGDLSNLVARSNLRALAAALAPLPPTKAKDIIVWSRNPECGLITDVQADFLIKILGLERA